MSLRLGSIVKIKFLSAKTPCRLVDNGHFGGSFLPAYMDYMEDNIKIAWKMLAQMRG